MLSSKPILSASTVRVCVSSQHGFRRDMKVHSPSNLNALWIRTIKVSWIVVRTRYKGKY